MRTSGFIVASFVLYFFSCQQSNGCRSGVISVATSGNILNTSNQKDLPEDFAYSSSDMINAISGYWVNGNNDTILHINLQNGSKINWNITVEELKCGPTFARLYFQGTSYPEKISILNGKITFYTASSSGDVEITLSNIPYSMKYHFNSITSSHHLVQTTNIPDLNLSQGDTLTLQ